MPKYKKRRNFRKRRNYKKNSIIKRVKKLENLTKNTAERSYRYNTFSMSNVTDVGEINQDPFDLLSISTIQPPSATSGFTNYGQRIGDRITITNMNIQGKIKFVDTNSANRWCRVRVILFKLSDNTSSVVPAASDAQINDILNMSIGQNVGCGRYYRKESQVRYNIIKDKIYIVGNKLGDSSVITPGGGNLLSYSGYSNCKWFNWNMRFKKGLNIEYDGTGNIRSNQYRLLLVTENDVTGQANIRPDIHFKTLVNYIM